MKRFLVFGFLILALAYCKKSSKDPAPSGQSPCFDGIQDNGETGVDCGGPCTACPKQWTAIPSGTSVDLFNVFFVNESNGWAVGASGTIIHSSDSGNTWSSQTSGVTDTLYSVCFVNPTTGWIASVNHILKTTDRGNNWSIVTNAGTNQFYYTISFFDSTKGWAGGIDSGWPFLDYTTTGGLNWQRKYSGQFTNRHGIIRSFDFINQNIGYAVGSDSLGLALQTSDGNTWGSVNIPNSPLLYGCDFSSQSDGWTVGNHNYYFDAASGTWHVQSFLPDNVTLHSVKVVSTGQGWAVGDAGTVYKRTGAYEWTSVPNISTAHNLYSLSISGNTGCIVGEAGTLYVLK